MLIGHASVLAQLERALQDTAGGCATRLLVTGEPGIGKTTLLAHLADQAAERGSQVLRAVALDGDQELPFAVLADLVRSARRLPERLGDHRDLLSQLGEGTSGIPAAQAGAALLALLAALSESGPVLVCVDDLHWADPPSRRAIVLASGRLLAEPVFVLAASREPVPEDPTLLRWPRLVVPSLEPDEAAALLRQVSLGAVPSHVARRIVAKVGGNPLALTESLAALPAAVLAGQAPLPDPLPTGEGVQAAYAEQFVRLPQRTREAALVLATVGASRWDLVCAVLDRTRLHPRDLEPAVETGLLIHRPDGCVDFRHPEIRAVAYQRADPRHRRTAHLQTAEAARRLGLSADLVVSHLTRSTAAPDERVATALQEEAHRAQQAGYDRVATAALEAAARLTPDPVRRVERAVRAVWLRDLATGDASGAEPLLDLLAGARLSAEDTAAVRWLQADALGDADMTASLTMLLDLAEDTVGLDPSVAAVILIDVIITSQFAGVPDAGLTAARTLCQELKALPSRPADLVGVELAASGSAAMFAGQVATAVPLVLRARSELARVDDAECPALSAFIRLWLVDGLIPLDDASWDSRVRRQKDRNVREDPGFLAWVRGWEAEQARRRGRLRLAQAFAAEAVELSTEIGLAVSALQGRGVGILAAALTGSELPTARQREAVRAQCAVMGLGWDLARLDRAEGLVALCAGDLDAATTRLRSCADAGFAGRGPQDTAMPALVDLVEACERAGDHAASLARMPGVAEWFEPMPDPHSAALLARARALVARDPDDADRSYADALAAHHHDSDPFEAARTRLLLGGHLRRTRRRAAARSELMTATTSFDQLGAKPWADLGRQELRACGVRAPSGTAPAAASTLTAQEQRVAEAVAEGRSNREVAAALFLSPRTVEFHLSSAYRKLGVSSRTALVRALHKS